MERVQLDPMMMSVGAKAFTSHIIPGNIPGHFPLLCMLFVLTPCHVKSDEEGTPVSYCLC